LNLSFSFKKGHHIFSKIDTLYKVNTFGQYHPAVLANQ